MARWWGRIRRSSGSVPPVARRPGAAPGSVGLGGGAGGPPLSARLLSALGTLRAVLRNRDLAALEASWVASVAGSWIFLIGALVLAYRLAGPLGVGLVGLARMLPAALVAPLIVLLERRVAGRSLLLAVHAVRIAMAGLVVLGLLGGVAAAALLPLVAVKAAAGALVRPANASLVPAIATSPEELVAANVSSSIGEGIGTLAGPIAGGFLAAVWGPTAAFVAGGVALAIAFACAAAMRVGEDALARPAEAPPLRAAWVALRDRPGARLVVACFVGQVFVRGLLSVLLVVAAINLLGLGDSGVGLLNAAIGLGGLGGALLALGLAGGGRLARPFTFGLIGWGLPIVILGAAPVAPLAIAALVGLGASNAVLDVSGFSLLQRLVPNAQRSAVFGVLEGIVGAGVAAGSIAAPPLIAVLGAREAMVATGLILPLLAVAAWSRLAHLDAAAVVPERELGLLRSLAMFAPLPLTVVERLAGALIRVEFAPGDLLTRQGDAADCFYALESGEVEVVREGRLLRTCGPGSAVGEIGLLRHVPRTATVRAVVPTVAYAVRGEEFVAAVSNNRASTSAAEGMIAGRLGSPEEAAGALEAQGDGTAAAG